MIVYSNSKEYLLCLLFFGKSWKMSNLFNIKPRHPGFNSADIYKATSIILYPMKFLLLDMNLFQKCVPIKRISRLSVSRLSFFHCITTIGVLSAALAARCSDSHPDLQLVACPLQRFLALPMLSSMRIVGLCP